MSPDGIVLGAGTIAFLGNMKEQGGLPSNGIRIVFSTAILAVVASIASNGPLREPVMMLAWLMVIVALIRYVPNFSAKKGK